MYAGPHDTSYRRSLALDGLRGYAAASVVIFHTILACRPQLIASVQQAAVWRLHGGRALLEKLVLSAVDGGVAVRIFFALSGIVLFRSMRRRRLPAARLFWSFAWRRLLRIYPVLAVCLVASWAVLALACPALPRLPRPDLRALGDNLALSRFDVVGATWTLHVELVMVPLLVAGFLVCRRLGRLGGLVCLAYTLAGHHWPVLLFDDPLLAGAAPFFALGYLIEQGVFDRLVRSRRGALVACLATATLFGQVLLPATMSTVSMLLQLASLPLLLAWLDRGVGGSPAHRLLEAPASLRLGRLSYSLYLWNVVVFELLLALLPGRLASQHALALGVAVGMLAIGLTLPLAAVSERVLERPWWRLWRHERTRRRLAATVATVDQSAVYAGGAASADIAQG